MFKRVALTVLLLLSSAVIITAATFHAFIQAATGINPNDLILLLVPVVTWVASFAVNWLKSVIAKDKTGFGGSVLVIMVVPIISFITAFVYDYLANPQLDFWILFIVGLGGVFLNEVAKQWKQSNAGIQQKAKTKLIG
jgi:hypothetical protein